MPRADAPVVALVNAVPAAIAPARRALEAELPDARIWAILDDRLIADADERGGVDDALQHRMRRLVQHAVLEGADGILLTCSLYGFVARQLAGDLSIPIYGPDDAAFTAVAESGLETVLLISSVRLALEDSGARLNAVLADAGASTRVVPVFVDGAFEASKESDPGRLAELVVAAVAAAPAADGVVFAQYSLAPAAAAVEEATGLSVFTGPGRAAAALRDDLEAS